MNDPSPLCDRVALVTGASSGIGTEIARQLSARGARVVAASRRPAEGLPEGVAWVALDLRDESAVASLPDRLPADCRSVTVLVNAAGHDVGGRRRFDERPMSVWSDTVETNLIGTMRVCHAIVPGMVERGDGDIVNIGSIAGLAAYPGGTAYVAGKYGVHGFSEALRADLGAAGIRVLEVLPGLTRSSLAARRFGDEAAGDAYYAAAPMVLDAADVARCVVFALEQPRHVALAQIVVRPRVD